MADLAITNGNVTLGTEVANAGAGSSYHNTNNTVPSGGFILTTDTSTNYSNNQGTPLTNGGSWADVMQLRHGLRVPDATRLVQANLNKTEIADGSNNFYLLFYVDADNWAVYWANTPSGGYPSSNGTFGTVNIISLVFSEGTAPDNDDTVRIRAGDSLSNLNNTNDIISVLEEFARISGSQGQGTYHSQSGAVVTVVENSSNQFNDSDDFLQRKRKLVAIDSENGTVLGSALVTNRLTADSNGERFELEPVRNVNDEEQYWIYEPTGETYTPTTTDLIYLSGDPRDLDLSDNNYLELSEGDTKITMMGNLKPDGNDSNNTLGTVYFGTDTERAEGLVMHMEGLTINTGVNSGGDNAPRWDNRGCYLSTVAILDHNRKITRGGCRVEHVSQDLMTSDQANGDNGKGTNLVIGGNVFYASGSPSRFPGRNRNASRADDYRYASFCGINITTNLDAVSGANGSPYSATGFNNRGRRVDNAFYNLVSTVSGADAINTRWYGVLENPTVQQFNGGGAGNPLSAAGSDVYANDGNSNKTDNVSFSYGASGRSYTNVALFGDGYDYDTPSDTGPFFWRTGFNLGTQYNQYVTMLNPLFTDRRARSGAGAFSNAYQPDWHAIASFQGLWTNLDTDTKGYVKYLTDQNDSDINALTLNNNASNFANEFLDTEVWTTDSSGQMNTKINQSYYFGGGDTEWDIVNTYGYISRKEDTENTFRNSVELKEARLNMVAYGKKQIRAIINNVDRTVSGVSMKALPVEDTVWPSLSGGTGLGDGIVQEDETWLYSDTDSTKLLVTDTEAKALSDTITLTYYDAGANDSEMQEITWDSNDTVGITELMAGAMYPHWVPADTETGQLNRGCDFSDTANGWWFNDTDGVFEAPNVNQGTIIDVNSSNTGTIEASNLDMNNGNFGFRLNNNAQRFSFDDFTLDNGIKLYGNTNTQWAGVIPATIGNATIAGTKTLTSSNIPNSGRINFTDEANLDISEMTFNMQGFTGNLVVSGLSDSTNRDRFTNQANLGIGGSLSFVQDVVVNIDVGETADTEDLLELYWTTATSAATIATDVVLRDRTHENVTLDTDGNTLRLTFEADVNDNVFYYVLYKGKEYIKNTDANGYSGTSANHTALNFDNVDFDTASYNTWGSVDVSSFESSSDRRATSNTDDFTFIIDGTGSVGTTDATTAKVSLWLVRTLMADSDWAYNVLKDYVPVNAFKFGANNGIFNTGLNNDFKLGRKTDTSNFGWELGLQALDTNNTDLRSAFRTSTVGSDVYFATYTSASTISQIADELDARLLTRDNQVNHGLLKPSEDLSGNIVTT